MNIIYEVNGKKFNDKSEAIAYENMLNNKSKRKEEVDKARDEYFKLLNKFNEDFGDEQDKKSIDVYDLISELFGV